MTATASVNESSQATPAAGRGPEPSADAHALRYLLLAECNTARHPELEEVAPAKVERVTVIGAGTMGSGIALAALDGGLHVTLLDQDPAALARGMARIHQRDADRVAAGKLTADAMAQRRERLASTSDWATLATADLIIEAVFERLDVKQAVFRQIDAMARPGAVLATNTSYLDLDAIAGTTRRPQDVVGLHFFSPAQVMRLVEVVRGARTSPATLATALAVARQLRKLPVVTANAFGFIGNRIYAAYRRQCEFMLEEGAYPDEVDAALEAFGFAMGPFAVGDMSGLDIAWHMRQSQASSRRPGDRYVTIPDRLCEAGRLGRKTHAGYYAYQDGRKLPGRDPVVAQLIDAASQAAGITRRTLAAEEIQWRALVAMANEAALLLAEGVARRPSDCDVVLVNGYGFPKAQGGAVFWARQRGCGRFERDVAMLAACSGPGFVPCHPDLLFSPEQ